MKKLILMLIFCLFTIKKSFSQVKLDSLVPKFIDEWRGRPYRFGGVTQFGIDCSALVQRFYKTIFALDIPRTCSQQWKRVEKVLREDLQIGDIIFFKSRLSPSGWHCGVFIGDGEFLHAANRKEGVKISSLVDPKYVSTIIGFGRFLVPDLTVPNK